MERYGAVIGIKGETIERYTELHAEIWPDLIPLIKAANIANYSIFLKRPENLLFAYYEYHGTDLTADMATLAAHPRVKEWFDICGPMQIPFDTRTEGQWWARMKDVFFLA
jgi:L-rhamnose mutarotase